MGQRGRPRHPDVLTPREQDVLALVRDGLTNEQIAERLNIGFETAKSHVAEILSKLGVSTREEAAAWRPEAEPRWSFGRVVLALAATGVVAAAVAGLALLTFGVYKSSSSTAEIVGGWPSCSSVNADSLAAGIELFDARTCSVTQLTNGGGETDGSVIWDSSQNRIAFVRTDPTSNVGENQNVFEADLNTLQVTQVTDTTNIAEDSPEWSPDGDLLYRTLDLSQVKIDPNTGVNEEEWRYNLVLYPPDGNTRILVNDALCLEYDLSPPGDQIAVQTGCSGNSRLSILDISTGQMTLVAEGSSGPQWSPSGGALAYFCNVGLGSDEYGVCIKPASGESYPLTNGMFSPLPEGADAGKPVAAYYTIWSGDGDTLALGSGSLYLWSPGGGPGRLITDWQDASLAWLSANVISSVRCDPSSGGFIPCGRYQTVSRKLSDGSEKIVLVAACGTAGQWSPDGQMMAISVISHAFCGI